MKDHYIVCGAGKIGLSAIKYLQREKAVFLVIDKDEDKINSLSDEGCLCQHGDATQVNILEKASVRNAKGLLACLPTDFDNIMITLISRTINPELHIVTNVVDNPCLLRRAGANNTFTPAELAVYRLAASLINPALISFLDLVTNCGARPFMLEQAVIQKGSPLVGKTLQEVLAKQKDLTVLFIKTKEQDELFNAYTFYDTLEEGCELIALGSNAQVSKLKDAALGNVDCCAE